MTVAELIAELQKFDPAMRVLQAGSPEGGGFDDIDGAKIVPVLLGCSIEWGGAHAEASDYFARASGIEPTDCLVIV